MNFCKFQGIVGEKYSNGTIEFEFSTESYNFVEFTLPHENKFLNLLFTYNLHINYISFTHQLHIIYTSFTF